MTYGRAIAATFGVYVIFNLFRTGIVPFIAGNDTFLFIVAHIAMLNRGVAEDTGKIKQEMGPLRFELRTSAMSRRRHSQLDHEPS